MALISGRDEDVLNPERRQACGMFTQDMTAKGYFRNGDALLSAETATCVSVRNGKTELKDAPFSATPGHLSGYYSLECANLDKAFQCAAKIPGAVSGTVELRSIVGLR